MTERERWIVYPILLLTLGISLRDKFTQSLSLREISCETLHCEHVVAADTRAEHVIGEHFLGVDASLQKIDILGPDNKKQLVLSAEKDKSGGGGSLAAYSAQGKPGLALRATPTGGMIEIIGPGGVVAFFDIEAKRARTMGLRGDQVSELRVPTEQSGEKPEDGSGEKPSDQPGQDEMPDEEKPDEERPAESDSDKPAEPSSEAAPDGNDKPSAEPTDEPTLP